MNFVENTLFGIVNKIIMITKMTVGCFKVRWSVGFV